MYETGYYATGYYATGYFVGSGFQRTLLAPSWYSLIFEARVQLQDGMEGCYRYPDSMLLNILNRGLHDLSRIRPDAYFDGFLDNDLNVPEITELNWGEPISVDLMFFPPLVAYVAGMAEASEDEYFEDGRAAGKLSMFKTYVLGL